MLQHSNTLITGGACKAPHACASAGCLLSGNRSGHQSDTGPEGFRPLRTDTLNRYHALSWARERICCEGIFPVF